MRYAFDAPTPKFVKFMVGGVKLTIEDSLKKIRKVKSYQLI